MYSQTSHESVTQAVAKTIATRKQSCAFVLWMRQTKQSTHDWRCDRAEREEEKEKEGRRRWLFINARICSDISSLQHLALSQIVARSRQPCARMPIWQQRWLIVQIAVTVNNFFLVTGRNVCLSFLDLRRWFDLRGQHDSVELFLFNHIATSAAPLPQHTSNSNAQLKPMTGLALQRQADDVDTRDFDGKLIRQNRILISHRTKWHDTF